MSKAIDISNIISEINKNIQQNTGNPLKKLEGMLALEKQKDGTIKTVFAGSRDYSGSKTETKNS